MLMFLQANWGTIVAAFAVTFIVFLAIRIIVHDKREGIGICGQKCSQCPKMGNCEEAKSEIKEPEQSSVSCDGICSGCPHCTKCQKK